MDQYRSPGGTRHRRRRRSTVGGTDQIQPSRTRKHETRRPRSEHQSSSSDDDAATQSGSVKDKPTRRRTKVVYVSAAGARSPQKERPRSEAKEHPGGSSRRTRSHRSGRASTAAASPPKRSVSTREKRVEAKSTIKRSNTISSAFKPTIIGTANGNNKRSSFLEGFFGGPTPQQHREPEKLVECLACMADDIPKSKAAKLKCGHRMCNSCLKRLFKLSITDPQHMPPKCCTAEHIPLKHVDKLFDVNFKKTWNRKFQEFSTKNRIYCPARRCGEWIKPADIHKENGTKYGKCSRCKTKTCCLCNGKWHGKKDCPKDEETNQLLETAKQSGWQRCYNCRTMVELKEGCNHMTCHCNAEFCMVCGEKWKTCDCPWFNYETVEEDRLNHMRVPGFIFEGGDGIRPIFQQPPRPPDFLDQIFQNRRRQDRAEREAIRRLARVDLGRDNADDDYQGQIGEIHGIGNGAGHFMNENYVRGREDNLAADIGQAAAAANHAMGAARARDLASGGGVLRRTIHRPVPLRRHTVREQTYNAAPTTRPSERVVPQRIRRDYESEAAVHAPPERTHQRSASNVERPTPSRSALAGLKAKGSGRNRVSAWRRHVEPGLEPTEVLSV